MAVAGQLALACGHCGGPLPGPEASGRPREFCSDTCRKAAHRQRQHELAAIQVADDIFRLILKGHDSALRRALARLSGPELSSVRREVLRASQGH